MKKSQIGGDEKIFVTEKEISKNFSCSVSWLRKRRHFKDGPPYLKRLGKVLYSPAEVESWFRCENNV